MKIDFKNLLSKVKNLHQIIASLAIENDSLQTQNTTLVSEKESLLSENDLLRYQLKLLKAKKFGRLSEKLNSQIEQLELWIEENELTCAEAVATDFSTSKELNKEKPKRLKFPEHLAREDIILNPEATCPECGGTNWRKIADDISEKLTTSKVSSTNCSENNTAPRSAVIHHVLKSALNTSPKSS